MKRQLLEIDASVLADAPTWGTAKPPAPPNPPKQEDKDLQKLLARIESTELPAAYSWNERQPNGWLAGFAALRRREVL